LITEVCIGPKETSPSTLVSLVSGFNGNLSLARGIGGEP